ncbi:MAG: aminopeptidase P family protein [Candidatus Symbiothrix sp.]|nr:aminopeptidase P family protein [Candidatus Symbiothrix sp.]
MGRIICETQHKLSLLRDEMRKANLEACIIPTTDAHIGEYTPDHWKTRQWISGFTGSAGTVVVTLDKAGLWTDSRYFLQADEQLKNTGIDLFKAGLPETPSFETWLQNELPSGATVGIEAAVYAASDAIRLTDNLKKHGITVNSDFAPYDRIWTDRPAIPTNKAFVLPEKYTGESASSKIARLVQELKKADSDATILVSLDMIAWLFNLRGNDISYNPVAVAFAYISEHETRLFIHPDKLTPEVSDYLHREGVVLDCYDAIDDFLRKSDKQRILITPDKINYHLYQLASKNCQIVEVAVHPVDTMKALKNETEIAGFRQAMLRDGVALVKFLYWLHKQLANNQRVTELSASQRLKQFRSEQALFISESFETISGYNEHGAIVHYAVTPESDVEIKPKGVLLLDSGGQYLDGTTDITRTIAVGEVSDEMRRDYTMLLKGNIALSQAIFPKGTIGMQLDILARQFIWADGINYLHGTGHGVGHCLNVHEGPHSIRMNYNPVQMQVGMTCSNEPGVYKAGRYGLRIENILLTQPCKTTEFGEFLCFDVLTLCPLENKLIDDSLLTAAEKAWVEAYHLRVREALSPCLAGEEKEYLKQLTR